MDTYIVTNRKNAKHSVHAHAHARARAHAHTHNASKIRVNLLTDRCVGVEIYAIESRRFELCLEYLLSITKICEMVR
jgi:hypothetical protein